MDGETEALGDCDGLTEGETEGDVEGLTEAEGD